MNLRSELKGLLTGITLAAAAIVVAASAPVLFPGQPLLQSLRPHLAGGLIVLVIALFVAGARWRALGFAGVAALSLGHSASIIIPQQQARAEVAARPVAGEFDLLSFNILNSNYGSGARIVDMILARDPDVVVLMEAAPLFADLERLRAVYPHGIGCEVEATCDSVMLSKTPLENARIADLGFFSPRRVIWAVSEIGGQRVNLIAVHMTKPYFDYASEGEGAALTRLARGLEGPVVITGDFNAAPWSGNLIRLARNADLLTGNAYPGTWPVELGDFGVPIDTMFTRAPALIADIQGLPDPMGSNHRGLIARITLAAE